MNNFQVIASFLDKARGKRTYTLVAILIVYILACDFTGRQVNEHVMGVLAALVAATFRAALPEKTK